MKEKEILQNSLDCKIYVNELICYGALCAVFAVIFGAFALTLKDARPLLAIIPTAVLFLFLLWFYLRRIKHLLHDPEKYVFYETTLEKPTPSFNKTVFFFITIRDENGTERTFETSAVGATAGLTRPNFSALTGKKALVAVDTENARVVVIKVIE